jgi:photosystem II stability/assembly factor-like uncharacterized protein
MFNGNAYSNDTHNSFNNSKYYVCTVYITSTTITIKLFIQDFPFEGYALTNLASVTIDYSVYSGFALSDLVHLWFGARLDPDYGLTNGGIQYNKILTYNGEITDNSIIPQIYTNRFSNKLITIGNTNKYIFWEPSPPDNSQFYPLVFNNTSGRNGSLDYIQLYSGYLELYALSPLNNTLSITGPNLIGQAQTIDTSSFNDPEATSPSFSYTWYVSYVDFEYYVIKNATSASYTLTSNQSNKWITGMIEYIDNNGVRKSMFSTGVKNNNVAPYGNVGITGSAFVGQILAAYTNDIYDADGPDPIPSFNYQWLSSTDNTTFTDISGETSSTLLLTTDQKNTYIKLRVSYIDTQGNLETLTSDATPMITEHTDTLPTGNVVITGLPYAYEVLSADTGGISDPDVSGPIVFTYQWSYTPQDNIAYSDISGATSSTFQIPLELTNGTDPYIKVTVSYTDDYANITSLTSDPIGPIILNPDDLSSYVWTAVGMSATGNYMVAISSKIAVEVSIGNQILPQNGMLIVSSDYGETWQQKRSGFLEMHDWNGVAVSADGKYMLATCDKNNDLTEIPILSSDFGNTWNYINDKTNLSNANIWRSPSMTANGQIMVLRNGQSNTIIDNLLKISYDFGQTWSLLPKPSSISAPKSIKISSDGRYLLSSTVANNLYISSNYGNSWELIHTGSGPIEQNIQTSADFSIITVYNDTTMAVSYNYGKSFTILTLPTSFIDGATTISADGTLLASIKGNQLYVSNDSLYVEKPVQSLELGTNNQSIKLYTDNSLSLLGQHTSYINNTETVTTFTFAKTTMDIQDLSGSSVTLSTLNTIYIEKTPSATVNLPAVVDTNGAWISITNATGSNITIDANGNTILSTDGSGTDSTRTIAGGGSIKFVYSDTVWYPFV